MMYLALARSPVLDVCASPCILHDKVTERLQAMRAGQSLVAGHCRTPSPCTCRRHPHICNTLDLFILHLPFSRRLHQKGCTAPSPSPTLPSPSPGSSFPPSPLPSHSSSDPASARTFSLLIQKSKLALRQVSLCRSSSSMDTCFLLLP